MKRIFLLIFFIPTLILGQDMSNSIGVITLNENSYNKENGLIEFLDEDGDVWYSFTFYYDDSDGKWDYPNDEFNVLAFHPDYFLLKMRCVKQDEEFFTVVVNEHSKLTKKIRRTPGLMFQNWEQYVLDASSVSFESLNNPVLKEIDGEKYEGELPKFPFFQPVEIKDDWMKIKWATNGMPTADSNYEFGWIKWKSHKRIIVDVFYIM